jgi:hypothetical protein
MKMTKLVRDAGGQVAIDQGEHHGHPITYNPDDERFYVHRPGTTNGTEILGGFSGSRGFSNALQFARRKAKEARP